ncbi:MAG: Stp1/IreP family PP2C-type Ser/Thr phosphatase [Chloroflexota bacterium]
MPQDFEIVIGQLSDVGKDRDHNEDSYAVLEPVYEEELARKGRYYAVADGMGGHLAGEVASRFAVDQTMREYYANPTGDVAQALTEAVKRVNEQLFQKAAADPGKSGMGSTLVAAVLRGNELYVANVGDSRAYVLRNHALRQITRDHSLVAEQVRAGVITPEQAQAHPRRNVLLRSLGTQLAVEVDVFKESVQSGDVIVLCSDGLWGQVPDERIADLASQADPQRAVQEMIRLANEAGGPDNITALALVVKERTATAVMAQRFRDVWPYARLLLLLASVFVCVAALGIAVWFFWAYRGDYSQLVVDVQQLISPESATKAGTRVARPSATRPLGAAGTPGPTATRPGVPPGTAVPGATGAPSLPGATGTPGAAEFTETPTPSETPALLATPTPYETPTLAPTPTAWDTFTPWPTPTAFATPTPWATPTAFATPTPWATPEPPPMTPTPEPPPPPPPPPPPELPSPPPSFP